MNDRQVRILIRILWSSWLLVLVLIFGILLGAVLFIQYKSNSQRRTTRIGETTPIFKDLSADQIVRIEIDSVQKESLILRKNAGVWEVAKGKDVLGDLLSKQENKTAEGQEGETPPPTDPRNDPGPSGDSFRVFHRADADKVQLMLDAMVELPSGQIITSAADDKMKTQMGVSNAIVGTEVIFFDAQMNKLADIMIGNPVEAYSATLVRKPDSDEIYQVPGQLEATFGTSLIMLRDKKIFNSTPQSITSVVIQDVAGPNSFNLSRSEGAWVGNGAQGNALELDAAKVDNLLSTLGTLSANSFVDPNDPRRPPMPEENLNEEDPYGFQNPNKIIEFKTTGNETFRLIVGKLEGTTYYAAVANNLEDIFRVSKISIENVSPDPAILAPGAEESAAELPGDRTDTGTLQGGSLEEIPPELLEQLRQQGQ